MRTGITESLRDSHQYLFAVQAHTIEQYAREIALAQNPIAKLEELRPYITHPKVDGGNIPWIFSCIALAVAGMSAKDLWEGRAPVPEGSRN
jgi:hypothetical protein